MDGLTIAAVIIGGLLAIISSLLVVVVGRTGNIQKSLDDKMSKTACEKIREKEDKKFDNHEHNGTGIIVRVHS